MGRQVRRRRMTAWDKSSLNGGAPKAITHARRTVGAALPPATSKEQRRRGETRAEPKQGRGAERDGIVYTQGRCCYMYDGGSRCVYEGRLADGRCAAHRDSLLRERRERKQREDKRRTQAPALPRQLDHVHDHTAPWKCTLDGCARCAEKPTFESWSEMIEERRTSPSGA